MSIPALEFGQTSWIVPCQGDENKEVLMIGKGINQHIALVEQLMQLKMEMVELIDKLTGRQMEREVMAAVQKMDAEVELHEAFARIDRQQMLLRIG